MKLPQKGMSREEVLAMMRDLRSGDADWRSGKTWSLVYFADDETLALLKDAYAMFFSENGLSPMAFPSLKKFESEVAAMTADMLGGGFGSMTSGGTESILLAVKAAREWARNERPQISEPEMLLPITAHPAFEKAAHYFSVKPVHYPTRDDLRADPAAARALLTDNTILIVGSAPAYPHGVIDPIPELASIAAERGILFHTDACLGGFLLPWMKKIGYDVPPFDLSVPGVTSISADIHKYGFAGKGASTLTFKTAELRKYQFFTYTNWPGGLYGSPGVLGTRAGGSIAAAWAAMRHFGGEGYMNLARKIMGTAKKLQDGIRSVGPLKILSNPDMSVFAFTSDEINIFALGDAMENRGWHLDRQQLPSSLHMMVTPAHEPVADKFIADLREACEEARHIPEDGLSGKAAMYGMVAALPDKTFAKDLIVEFLSDLLAVEES